MEIVRSRDRILELDGVGGAGAGAREGRRPAAKRLPPRPHDLCAARSGPASTAASRVEIQMMRKMMLMQIPGNG
uniref:Uncharacterized protein n=1 Tax=Oryza rufipogon TaxID=4529 RepID=A0A0E0PTC9_ORYRU